MNRAISLSQPRSLAHRTDVSPQNCVQVGYPRHIDVSKFTIVAHARSRKKDDEEPQPQSYEEVLLQREQLLWNRQTEMMEASANEARTNYETLLRAHAQLQTQQAADRESWAKQEELLRKENSELRAQLLYTAAQLASAGDKLISNLSISVNSNSTKKNNNNTNSHEDDGVLDGRAAAAELPSASSFSSSSRPSSVSSSSVTHIHGTIAAAGSSSNSSSNSNSSTAVPSWVSEIQAAMEAVDDVDILSQDVDYIKLAKSRAAAAAPPPPQAAAAAKPPPLPPAAAAGKSDADSPATTTTTTTTTTSSSPTGPPILSLGSEDIFWVSQLHTALVDLGYYPGDDDVDVFFYGDSTQSALMTMQACEGLAETGVVDDDTWGVLLGPDLILKPTRDLTADQSMNLPGVTSPLLTPSGGGGSGGGNNGTAAGEEVERKKKPFAELFTSVSEQATVVGEHGEVKSMMNRTTVTETDVFGNGDVVEDSISVQNDMKVSVDADGRTQQERDTSTARTHREMMLTKWPILIDGDGGKAVHALHVLLDDAGFFCGGEDTEWWQFGSTTQAALKTYQACNGLPESGAVDVRTWHALLGPNATPADIFTVQSGKSDDEDLADDAGGTRLWLMGEQRWADRST